MMVDRMDKIKPVRRVRVDEPANATDRQRREQSDDAHHDDEQSEYSSPGTPAHWHKFHAPNADRRIVRVAREQIAHCWFRRVILQRQTAILEVIIALQDGTQYDHAMVLLPRFDEYFHFKGYASGQEIPLLTHLHDPVLELSIATATRQQVAAPAPQSQFPRHQTRPHTPWWSVFDEHTGELRIGTLALYAGMCLVLIAVIVVGL